MNRELCITMLALTLSTAHAVGAGDLWFGVRGGPSLPQLSGGGDELTRDYESILAPNFGLLVNYFFTKHWSLQVEAVYSVQGGERDGLQPITQTPAGLPPNPVGPYYYADFDNKSILEYFEVPILAKYQVALSKHLRCFAEGGPYVGFLLNAEQRTRGYSQIYLDKSRTPLTIGDQPLPPVSFRANTDVEDSLNPVNVGIAAGLGVGCMLSDRQQIFIDVRGQYGFVPLQKDTDEDGESYAGAVVFSLGYMLQIGD
ncbi:MAG: PorT family protein [Sedimentisphaerales bacterium]|nr:PorT family protein [Sedimentisphaerales bacterium]